MAHEGLQIDADERGGHQAEDRQGAETSAHARLAEEACAPGMLVRHALERRAGVGDGDEMAAQILFGDIGAERVEDDVEIAQHLDRGAGFAGYQHERAFDVDRGQRCAHAHRGDAVEHLEIERIVVGLVVLGDGHRRLRRAAFADEDDVTEAACNRLIGEFLDLGDRKRRTGAEVGPSHEMPGALAGALVESVQRGVFREEPSCDLVSDERSRRRVGRFILAREHSSSIPSQAHAGRLAAPATRRLDGALRVAWR